MSQQPSPIKSSACGAAAVAKEEHDDADEILELSVNAPVQNVEYGSQEEESDSELDNEIEIDDVGNVLEETAPQHRAATSTLQNLLTGYGPEVVDSIVQCFL